MTPSLLNIIDIVNIRIVTITIGKGAMSRFEETKKKEQIYDAQCANEFLAKAITGEQEFTENEKYGALICFEMVNKMLAEHAS